MATKDFQHQPTIQQIQQIQQDEKDLRIMSSLNKLQVKSLSNPLLTEFDIFSVPVKLNINGSQNYKTIFGGLLHMGVIAICVLLTISVIYQNKVELNSEITQTIIAKDYGDNGQTIFDYIQEPISLKAILQTTGKQVSLNDSIRIKFYQVKQKGQFSQLQLSKHCKYGGEYCIKKTQKNKEIKILGSIKKPQQRYSFLRLQVVWCDTVNNPNQCSNPGLFLIEITHRNLYKQKNGKLTQYSTKNNFPLSNSRFKYDVNRQIYETNYKFFGHIANIFSYEIYSYKINSTPQDVPSKRQQAESFMLTQFDIQNYSFIQIDFVPVGQTYLLKQEYDDISQTFLFFLSVKQTIYIIIFFFFIKEYNQNSGYLQIADSLYYIDDPNSKKKYDFKSGYQVFLVCWLHNHFIFKFINYILNKFGKTLNQYLPKKSICAINLMLKTQELLQENNFYGTLNDLSMMQNQPSKKIPLFQYLENENQQNQQQKQTQYYPSNQFDSNQVKKQNQIKKIAFEQFCQANNYYNPDRKNKIYKILTNNKLQYILAHQIQLQFKSFVRNVCLQHSQNLYIQSQESFEQNDNKDKKTNFIKVEIQNNNEITSEDFMKGSLIMKRQFE